MSDFRRKNEKKRVTRLVPKSEMDKDFLEYVRAWNNSNAKRQIMSLNKLMRFILDRTLPSDNQEKIRQECVTFWGLSSSSPSPQDRHFERKQQQQRTPPFVNLDKNDGMKLFYAANNRGYHHNAPVRDPWRRDENAHKIRQTMETECLDWRLQVPFGTQGGSRGNSSSSSSSSFAETLRKAKTFMHNPREWFCYRLPSGGQRTYLLATPSGIVMENLDANRGGGGGGRQRRFQRLAVRLGRHQGIPPDTVLEVVVCGQYIYAIDALCLGGDFNIWRRTFKERKELLRLFIDSIRGGGELIALKFSPPEHLFQFIDDQQFFAADDGPESRALSIYFIRDKPKPNKSVEFHMATNGICPLKTPLRELRDMLYKLHQNSKRR